MSYNGWANRETWNVILWINNDEPLYHAACEFVSNRGGDSENVYLDFVRSFELEGYCTPDGIEWVSDVLDYPALDEAMMDLVD